MLYPLYIGYTLGMIVIQKLGTPVNQPSVSIVIYIYIYLSIYIYIYIYIYIHSSQLSILPEIRGFYHHEAIQKRVENHYTYDIQDQRLH